MAWLIIGLAVFLGTHSLRIVADDWRSRQIARLGELPWKALYALVSGIGFGLVIWGYSLARQEALLVWLPPSGLRHATALLTLPAFILAIAAYLPGNRLKASIGHPLLLGVCLWAVGHLLSNGSLHGMLLFAGFLVWGLINLVSARRRGGFPSASPSFWPDVAVVIVGLLAWAGFARYGHVLLIGVAPLG